MSTWLDFNANPLNVFKGQDALARYFNPDENPPVPMIEIPDRLNPLRSDGVRIYAKMLTALPAQNVKALPALNMLLNEPLAKERSIVEASSGSTVLSLAMMSRILHGNEDVTAYVTNKKHVDQLRILRFFGLKVSLYGGIAQQEPTDPRGIMARLRRMAKTDSQICYPGQYDNPHNWKAHERWTGPQILAQIPEINVFCATVGTGGCITGTGVYLKSQKPSIKIVGVFNVFGDPTPGPRHFANFCTCGFPWRETVDELEQIESVESYRMSMQLSREGLICGPSSGEALAGLIKYLTRMKDTNRLCELVDPLTGEISCVFTCSDLPYQYLNGYFDRLGEDEFPVIENQILTTCDQDRYDERWELKIEDAVPLFVALLSNGEGRFDFSVKTTNDVLDIIDLRAPEDFDYSHFCIAKSCPLPGLDSQVQDIFGSSQLVHLIWSGLRNLFDDDETVSSTVPALVLCYDGDVSRMATSILRARGVEAYSVRGGFTALYAELKGCLAV